MHEMLLTFETISEVDLIGSQTGMHYEDLMHINKRTRILFRVIEDLPS